LTRPVQSVAVVGRDTALWMAALALRRALGGTGVRIQAVELPSALTAADVYSAVPSIGSLHRLLGIEEKLLLQACDAVPMVGQRFSNWAQSAPPFVLGYDDEPPPGGDISFQHFWTKGALEGLRVDFQDFSLGSACARLGRIPVAPSQPAPLAASYGYHIHSAAYSQLLRLLAQRAGVDATSGRIAKLSIEGERIGGIELEDGTRVEADLYIDASGAESRLIRELPGTEFESWRDWLPCNRILAASAPRLKDLPAFSQVSAFRGGWVGLFPLKSRTAVVAAYDSRTIYDREVADQLAVIARLPVVGDAVVGDLKPGFRGRAWVGNCVAIGEAAVALDPLDGLHLHGIHGCISYLMSVFPAVADRFPEAEAYNRSIRSFGANLRDWQAVHYKLNRRFDEPLWDRVRDEEPPESLGRRLDLFEARAVVTLYDDESFHEQAWASLFLGCGLRPKDYDPRVDTLTDEAHIQKVQERLRGVADLARQMPTVEQFLSQDQAILERVQG
jgi:tryptophan 7-halogenase